MEAAQLRVRLPAREVILAARKPGPTSVHNVIAALQKEQSLANEQHRNYIIEQQNQAETKK